MARTRPPRSPLRDEYAAPPAPRFALGWAAIVYALCTLALAYPALGGAFLVSPVSDQFHGYAYRAFASEFIHRTGQFPLWNPYLLGGMPYTAAGYGDLFYPTIFLRLILPVDQAMDWSFAIHVFLAGLFTYGLLRAWGLSFFPSLVGGIAYMLGGQVASLVSPGHDGKLYVSALTPLLLWMITRGMRDGRIWAWGVVSIATGLMVLSPHYQMTYYTGLLAIAYTVWLAFRGGEDAIPRPIAVRRLAAAVLAAAVGMAIGSIQFLPFFEYIPYAARGTARGYAYATSYSMPPEEIIDSYIPQFSGWIETYWGRNPIKLHSDYLGAAVLLLAGAAFGTRRWRGFVWFWSIAALVALLVALGGYTPFYRLWYLLPMMKVVRAPGMIYYIVSLAAALFAGIGTERILAGEKGARYLVWWAGAAIAIALLASVGFFQGLGTLFVPAEYPSHADILAADRGSQILGAWRSALFVLLTAGGAWLYLQRRVPGVVLGWALAAFVALDLWSIEHDYWRFSPPASVLYASDPAVRYLQQLRTPGRVFAYPLERSSNPDPFLDGDAMMIHDVRTLSGQQGNEIQRWVELAGAKSPAPPPNFLQPWFRRLTNVRFWYTNVELPEHQPVAQLGGMTLTKRVGPVRNAAGNEVYLYEIDETNPAAWVAPVIVEAAPASILATLTNAQFDPRTAALFDSTGAVTGVQVTAPPAPLAIAPTVTRYEPGHITVQLDQPAPAGAALVVSENWYPGWTATVDGKTTPTGRADYTFIGVPLASGTRQVDLVFHERPFVRGRALTLLALAVSLAVIGLGIVVDRRGRG